MSKGPVLITSDDGWTDGTKILLEAVLEEGYEAYAIVPEHRMSLCGKTLTIHKALRIHKLETTTLPVYTINGAPADAVAFAASGIEFPEPDVVLSGINAGENISIHGILGSGTSGGAIEGAFAGLKSYAFSYAIPYGKANTYILKTWEERDLLKLYVKRILKHTLTHLQPYEFLNINFPYPLESANIPMVVAKPTPKYYLASLEKRIDPSGRPYYWYTAKKLEGQKDEDQHLLFKEQKITITPIYLLGLCNQDLYDRWAKVLTDRV